jgi:hypothetical protein
MRTGHSSWPWAAPAARVMLSSIRTPPMSLHPAASRARGMLARWLACPRGRLKPASARVAARCCAAKARRTCQQLCGAARAHLDPRRLDVGDVGVQRQPRNCAWWMGDAGRRTRLASMQQPWPGGLHHSPPRSAPHHTPQRGPPSTCPGQPTSMHQEALAQRGSWTCAPCRHTAQQVRQGTHHAAACRGRRRRGDAAHTWPGPSEQRGPYPGGRWAPPCARRAAAQIR